MNVKMFMGFIIAFPTLTVAAQESERLVDRVVAIVGNDAITLRDVELRLAAGTNPVVEALSGVPRRGGFEAALEEVIAEKLLLTEAKKLGLSVSDQDVQKFINDVAAQNGWSRDELEAQLRTVGFANIKAYEEFVRKDLLRSQLLRMKVGARVHVSDREVEDEFSRQTEGGKTDEEIHLAHIVIRVPEHVTESEIRGIISRAKQIREMAASGDFAEIARQYSEDATAEKGGDAGWYPRGKLQSSIEEVAFSLKDGEVSQVVLSSVGLHILKSLGRRRVPLKDPEEVKARVKYHLSEAAFKKLYKEYISELREAAGVEVRWP